MSTDPTIDDFRDRIGWLLGKAENRAAEAASNILAQAAAKGALNSSRVTIFTWQAIQKEFEAGIEAVLGELRRVTRTTKLDPEELRQCAGQRLLDFVDTAERSHVYRTASCPVIPRTKRPA
jgi:hypothetical protein